MADKTTANIGFEKQLWDAACCTSVPPAGLL